MRHLTRLAARLLAGLVVVAVMAGPVIAVAYAAGNPIPADLLDRLAAPQRRRRDDRQDPLARLLRLLGLVLRPGAAAGVGGARLTAARPLRPAASPRPGAAPSRTVEPAAGGPRGWLAGLARFAVSGVIAASSVAPASPPASATASTPISTLVAPASAAEARTADAGFDGRGDVGGGVASGHAVRAGTALLPAGSGRRGARPDRRAERRSTAAGRHPLPGRWLPGGLERGHPRHPRRPAHLAKRTSHPPEAVEATLSVIDTAAAAAPPPTVRTSPPSRAGSLGGDGDGA